MKRAFAPVVDAGTRLLILGSLPGEASLTAGQYYANPRNAFWRLLAELLRSDIAALAYPDRLNALRAAGIGLWDVIASAERSGSLDSAIRSPEAADLRGLVAGLPGLRAVAFNGGKAAELGRPILERDADRLRLITLPSSSPAHTQPFAQKAAAWTPLKAFLND